MKTHYSVAPKDKGLERITARYHFLMIGSVVFILVLFLFKINWPLPNLRLWDIFIYLGIVLILYIIAWRHRPIGYEVGDDSITLIRPEKNITIPLSEINDVCSLDQFKLNVSLTENNLLIPYSYYGFRSSPDIGDVFMVATDKSRAVLINADMKYIISPEDSDAFVEDVKNRLTNR